MHINNIQSMRRTKCLSKLIFGSYKNRLFIGMYVTFVNSKMYFNIRKFKFKEYEKLLKNNTHMSDHEVKSVLQHTDVFNIPQYKLVRNCIICKNLGVSLFDIGRNTHFLYMSPQELENRILLLKEMGAQYINTPMIKTLAKNVPVTTFKAYSGIPKDVNIAKVLYSYLHKPPPEVPPLEDMDECLTVLQYRRQCLIHYLTWRFQLSNAGKGFLTKRSQKLYNKTFSSLKYSFDVLHNDGKLSINTIWNYRCLEKSSGFDLKRIFHDYQNICGVPILDLLKTSPALHKMKYKNVTTIKKYLEQYNITGEQLLNAPNILNLDEDYFVESWQRLMSKPQLRILLNHPYVLQILTISDNFNDRMNYLDHVGISDVTIHTLRQPTCEFEKFIKCGKRRQCTDEVIQIVANHLNLSTNRIIERLNKHPLWREVNLLNIHNTVSYLKAHFSNGDIEKNLQIVLYSKNKVKDYLEYLFHKNELMDESDRYSPSQILALCIYEMEKTFHFSGDGIWEKSD